MSDQDKRFFHVVCYEVGICGYRFTRGYVYDSEDFPPDVIARIKTHTFTRDGENLSAFEFFHLASVKQSTLKGMVA